ncbi:PP2C family protein-serine/threonine phosphatase [Nocardioides sp.]|uniref:PP2C family protein-serine/threonine phosphatase n=1 Tax=Nocardioides sp. TaxID=35761 RepID=UPI00272533C4|nr:PP2C family protein-serine/threonine phosphatase [Nocardioides sp.]MDO9457593.1 PP2C family protein-serine/threonine phosphatase [Nocardioides sp.]
MSPTADHRPLTHGPVTHPAGTAEAVVVDLTRELVACAQVLVRVGGSWVASAAVGGRPFVRAPDHRVPARTIAQATRLRGSAVTTLVLPHDDRRRHAMVDDALGDPALTDHVAALGPVTVVLAPLEVDGRNVGLATLVHRDDATPSLEQVLASLAELLPGVAARLDVSRNVAESRRLAGAFSSSLLVPDPPPGSPVLAASFVRVGAEDESVGGDFVDLHGDDVLTVLLGDAMGKGAVAGLNGERIISAVRTAALVDRDPAAILSLTNRMLLGRARSYGDHFATALCGRITETRQGTATGLSVTLASAGHPPPLVLREDGALEQVACSGPALGLYDRSSYRMADLVLTGRDTLVLYTDGVTEARRDGDLFGGSRVLRSLAPMAGSLPGAIIERLAMAVAEFHPDHGTRDDVAILALQHRARGGSG